MVSFPFLRGLFRARFQRVVQSLALGLFLYLLWRAAFPLPGLLFPHDLFLRMDPLVFLGTTLSAREWISGLWAALIVLAATLVLGRFFCGYLCPFGATMDFLEWMFSGKHTRKTKKEAVPPTLPAWLSPRLKYHVLALVLGAGVLGISLVFFAAPIPLVTRLYGLVVLPVLDAAADFLLMLIRPLAGAVGWDGIVFLKLNKARFGTQFFVLGFFIALVWASVRIPRFWCRYLCPAGALFALFSRRPMLRRHVSEACVDCGLCARRCPMGAIGADPTATAHTECVICETCAHVCPVNAVSFPFRPPRKARDNASLPATPGRRRFLWSGLSGMGVGLLAMAGLKSPHQAAALEGLPGLVRPRYLIRPPGAVPEHEFLAKCLRCGECMKACPTNTLQPIWFEAGFSALFSPTLTPLRGPCEPLCNVCGRVCPSGALRPLPLYEKQQAKLGTAYILHHKCLAWEQQKECLVCDEVCPYDAIELKRVEGNPVPVPFVTENRCAGCGFCQNHCPVAVQKAVVVEAMGALRLSEGSYAEAALAAGLDIRLRNEQQNAAPVQEWEGAPETGGDDLPPGFSNPD